MPSEITDLTPVLLTDIYIPADLSVHPHLRLRQKGQKYEITKKMPVESHDASKQFEYTIPLERFEYDLLTKVSSRAVSKLRYSFVYSENILCEVDVFQGRLKGLVLIDFEFTTDIAKAGFTVPDYCLADVTQEECIAGGILAGRGYSDIAGSLLKYNYQKL